MNAKDQSPDDLITVTEMRSILGFSPNLQLAHILQKVGVKPAATYRSAPLFRRGEIEAQRASIQTQREREATERLAKMQRKGAEVRARRLAAIVPEPVAQTQDGATTEIKAFAATFDATMGVLMELLSKMEKQQADILKALGSR